jgi:transposase
MKSMIKRMLRAAWKGLAPLRRPIARRVEARLAAFLEATVRPMVVEELERRVRPPLDATTSVVRENIGRTEDVVQFLRRSAQEDTMLLDSLVRELTRVQIQIEALRQIVDDRAATLDGDSAAERLMIGGASGR